MFWQRFWRILVIVLLTAFARPVPVFAQEGRPGDPWGGGETLVDPALRYDYDRARAAFERDPSLETFQHVSEAMFALANESLVGGGYEEREAVAAWARDEVAGWYETARQAFEADPTAESLALALTLAQDVTHNLMDISMDDVSANAAWEWAAAESERLYQTAGTVFLDVPSDDALAILVTLLEGVYLDRFHLADCEAREAVIEAFQAELRAVLASSGRYYAHTFTQGLETHIVIYSFDSDFRAEVVFRRCAWCSDPNRQAETEAALQELLRELWRENGWNPSTIPDLSGPAVGFGFRERVVDVGEGDATVERSGGDNLVIVGANEDASVTLDGPVVHVVCEGDVGRIDVDRVGRFGEIDVYGHVGVVSVNVPTENFVIWVHPGARIDRLVLPPGFDVDDVFRMDGTSEIGEIVFSSDPEEALGCLEREATAACVAALDDQAASCAQVCEDGKREQRDAFAQELERALAAQAAAMQAQAEAALAAQAEALRAHYDARRREDISRARAAFEEKLAEQVAAAETLGEARCEDRLATQAAELRLRQESRLDEAEADCEERVSAARTGAAAGTKVGRAAFCPRGRRCR